MSKKDLTFKIHSWSASLLLKICRVLMFFIEKLLFFHEKIRLIAQRHIDLMNFDSQRRVNLSNKIIDRIENNRFKKNSRSK